MGNASTPCSPDIGERLGRKLSEHGPEQSSQRTTTARIGARSPARTGRTFTFATCSAVASMRTTALVVIAVLQALEYRHRRRGERAMSTPFRSIRNG
jgi:hypothetical protein